MMIRVIRLYLILEINDWGEFLSLGWIEVVDEELGLGEEIEVEFEWLIGVVDVGWDSDWEVGVEVEGWIGWWSKAAEGESIEFEFRVEIEVGFDPLCRINWWWLFVIGVEGADWGLEFWVDGLKARDEFWLSWIFHRTDFGVWIAFDWDWFRFFKDEDRTNSEVVAILKICCKQE